MCHLLSRHWPEAGKDAGREFSLMHVESEVCCEDQRSGEMRGLELVQRLGV